MTDEEYVKDKLRDLARHIDGQIPMEHGFILLVFPYGPGGSMQYIANARRLDAIQAMREWIAKNTDDAIFATDAENKGTEGFDTWFAQQLLRYPEEAVGPEVKRWLYDAWFAGKSANA